MAKILVVEDDYQLSYLIRYHLEIERHSVDAVANGRDGLEALQNQQFELLILDWTLPELSGLDLLKLFRARGGLIPILLLTARASSDEKATGLDAGADDYIVKPFDPTELAARVRALLRRPAAILHPVLKVKDIELDMRTLKVTRSGRKIELAARELAILELLMKHPNQSFSAESILQRIWQADAMAVSLDTVRTHIKTLRKKLGDADENPIIQTTRRVGYCIIAE